MATLALVAGILSFLCLGPIGAVLAIVFGILGLGKAKEMNGNGRGLSIAGIVLGIVNIVLSIIGIIVFVILLGAASDKLSEAIQNVGGTAPASSYEIKVTSCSTDEFGYIDFSGTIKNTTNGSKNFLITTEVTDSAGSEIDTFPVPVTDIPPGSTAKWDANSFGDAIGSIDCRVTGVNNLLN